MKKTKSPSKTTPGIKVVGEERFIPLRATPGSAGYDLVSAENENIPPGETYFALTGISIEIPEGYVGIVASRSGLGARDGIIVKHGIGTIDSDYRGDLLVPLYNSTNDPYRIEVGDRIAQLIIIPCLSLPMVKVKKLSNTKRAKGGFGHTGQ